MSREQRNTSGGAEIFEFSISRLDTNPVVKIVGEVDVATAPQLVDALDGMASLPGLVLDLSEVTFLDSFGVPSIPAIASNRNGTGPLVILPSQAVARVFEILAVDQHTGIELRRDGDAPAVPAVSADLSVST